jgi:uncharacterized ion transporter superfamily protein YfcC
MTSGLFPNSIIFLIILIALLVMNVLKFGRKDLSKKNESVEEIALLEKKSSKKSYKPLFVLMIITFLFIMVGTFKWDAVIGGADKTPMLDFYKSIMDIKIGDFAIVSSLLGTIPALGYFELPFVSVFVLFMTIIIALVYKFKFNDLAEGVMDGLHQVLRIVIYIVLSNLVIAGLYKNGVTYNFVSTIIKFFMGISLSFNSFFVSIASAISSVFFNDFSTFMGNIYVPTRILTGSNVTVMNLTFVIFKSMFGLVSLVAPTSVLLVTGLAYFNVSVKEWFKNIWKLLLELFIVSVLVIVILTIFAF